MSPDQRQEFTVEAWNPLAEKNARPAPKVERDADGRLIHKVRSVPERPAAMGRARKSARSTKST